MNAEFRDHLAAGGEIEIDIVIDEIDIVASGEPIRTDLADKGIRRLLEHAAPVEGAAFGTIFLNR